MSPRVLAPDESIDVIPGEHSELNVIPSNPTAPRALFRE